MAPNGNLEVLGALHSSGSTDWHEETHPTGGAASVAVQSMGWLIAQILSFGLLAAPAWGQGERPGPITPEDVTLKGTGVAGAQTIVVGDVLGTGHRCIGGSNEIVSYKLKTGDDGARNAERSNSIDFLGVTQTSSAKVDIPSRSLEAMSQTSTRVCSGAEATESEGEAMAFFYATYQIDSDTPAAGAALNITVVSRLDGSLSGVGAPETVGRGMVIFALSAFPAPLPVSPGNWSVDQGISLVLAGGDSFGRIPVLPQKLASTASADLSALWLRSTGKPLLAGQCFVLMGSLGTAAGGGPAGNPRTQTKGTARFDFVLPSGVRIVEGCRGSRVLRQDVSVRKSHQGEFAAGGTSEYRIDVTNAGTAPTGAAIAVTDTLPAGLTPVTAGGTSWSCSVAGQTVTCDWTGAPLPGGASAPGITLRAAVSTLAPASVINTVKVTMAGDQDPANDSFSDPTVIRRP